MRATHAILPVLLAAVAGRAQVLAPEEIRDPQLRALQQKYRAELKLIATAAAVQNLPYHFYFSRGLDLEEKDQKRSDQRSIQFDRYQGRLVVKVTGNYFVSYSAELMKPEDRARTTYESVILPLLRAAIREFERADVPQAFAFEISHHVRKKVMGVSSEGVENLVLVIPKTSAQRLAASGDPHVQEVALQEGEAYLNAEPISFWPRAAEPAAQQAAAPALTPPEPAVLGRMAKGAGPPAVIAKVVPAPSDPARDGSEDAVRTIQKSYQEVLERMERELDGQAHFIRYAPPAFIAFHNGLYLQVPVTTALPAAGGSQYRVAALAFDQHIAHLIRPVLAYFKESGDFDGIDFSTTVRLASEQSPGAVAVEFIVPLKLLRLYADFDSTGQQLIDGSFVLINGERVSLNLQAAETGVPEQ